MLYLLDTNCCISFLNRSSQSIYDHIVALSPDDICICDVVKFELYFGAYKSSKVQQNLATLSAFFGDFVSMPFDGEAAAICGQVRATLQSRGTPIGAYDLQIAAIALSNDLTLVTHNTKEFQRVDNLPLVDWQGSSPQ